MAQDLTDQGVNLDLITPLYPFAGEGAPPMPSDVAQQFILSVRTLPPLQHLRTLHNAWGLSPTNSPFEARTAQAMSQLRDEHPHLPKKLGHRDPSDEGSRPAPV